MDEVATSKQRRSGAAICFILFFLLTRLVSSQGQGGAKETQPPSEYEVKAAFLLNFTKFIEWPADIASSAGPFTICVAGEDPFGPVLDQIVEGERVGNRSIVVRRLREPADGCEMLFVGKDGLGRAAIGPRRGVLTIGEGDFLRHGGVISFVVENRRVRFDVDERAAVRSGLRISSRLLKVARSVER